MSKCVTRSCLPPCTHEQDDIGMPQRGEHSHLTPERRHQLAHTTRHSHTRRAYALFNLFIELSCEFLDSYHFAATSAAKYVTKRATAQFSFAINLKVLSSQLPRSTSNIFTVKLDCQRVPVQNSVQRTCWSPVLLRLFVRRRSSLQWSPSSASSTTRRRFA
jgi:hypothetical protein